jgi:catechol 2,3-dioxygenase-like lactoylglutathione lyase family enzyme
MFAQSRLQAIVLTSRLEQAERFYRELLGLRVKRQSQAGVTFDVGGSDLLLGRVGSTKPSEHTIVGFAVPNLDAALAWLTSRGLSCVRFAGFPHAADGSVIAPDGARVVWIRDPDGNLLSVVEFASQG